MAQLIVRQSDLVLSVVGGVRHGKTISISTAKCVLAFDDNSPGANGQTRCAILRGKAGVTIRNLDKKVSFNGHLTPTHWLKEGDLIQFPNSVALRVAQLGAYEDEEAVTHSATGHVSTHEADKIEFQSNEFIDNAPATVLVDNQIQFVDDNQTFEHEQHDSFCQSPIEPIEVNRTTELVDSRFGEIEKRIEMLTEQISSLVTLATTGQFATNKLNEEEWRSYSKPISEQQEEQNSQTGISIATSQMDAFSEKLKSEEVEDSGFQPLESTHNPLVRDSHFDLQKTTDFRNAVEFEQPAVEGQISATSYSELADRSIQNQENNEGDSTFLTPFQRAENQDSQLSAMTEYADSESVRSQTHLESETPQSGSGQFGSFRAATNALDQLQTSDSVSKTLANSNPNFPQLSQNNAQTEAHSSNVSRATPSTDETLDALLKRLYQNQNASDLAGPNAADSLSASEEVPTLLSTFDQKQVLQNENSDPEIREESVATSSYYGNTKFGYDLGSNLIPGQAESTDLDGVEPTGDSSIGGSDKTGTIAASDQYSRVAWEPEAETIPSQSIQNEPQTSSGNSAIMDLLAKLKAEGAWDEDENVASHNLAELSNSNQLSEQVLDEPVSAFDDGSTPELATESQEESEVPAAIDDQSPVSADSVEDYMSQLLARMQKKRGDSEPAVKKSVEKEAKENQARADALAKTAGQELMTAEEYVPKQKAQKIHSFDTMREIANTTARTAVAYSDLDRRRTRGYMQIIITVGALIMAGYYFLFLSKEQGDTSFIIGCVCVAISLGAGYFAFRSLAGLNNPGKKASSSLSQKTRPEGSDK